MIRKFIYPFCFLTLLAGCTKTNVEISGTIKEAGRQKIYLEQLDVNAPKVIDSTETDQKGCFRFKTLVKDPTFYNLKFGEKESVTVIASADEHIEVSGTLKNLGRNYWVDGSDNSLWIKLLNFQLDITRNAMDSLQRMFVALPDNKENAGRRNEISLAWDSIVSKQTDFSRDFILKHAISPAAYYALYQKLDANNFILDPFRDLLSFKTVASSLKAMYPESQYTQAILKHLGQIGKDMQSLQIRQLIAQSENRLPGIALPDVKGDTVTLNSLKGKYVILDFNVLGAKESEKYIQELQNVYRKYKNRGVEIYQVCLDANQLLWKNLVQKYNIGWICVRDAESSRSRTASSWNVQTVPANYIISPASEIVGKNLTGRRLEERLNDLLKK